MHIPAIFHGPGIAPDTTVTLYSETAIAPSALSALGVEPGEFMFGKVFDQVYFKEQESL